MIFMEEENLMRNLIIIVGVVVLFTAGMMVSPGNAEVGPEDVIAMWLLDDVDDNIAEDLSGNGHDGKVVGLPKIEDGKFDGAVDITGSRIDVPDHENLNFDNDTSFTVVLWLNFENPQDWNRLVRERNPGPWGAGNYGWEVQTQGVQIHFSVDDAQGGHQKTSYPNLGDGEWHHGAMIVDRDEKMLKTYVDGEGEKKINIGNIEEVSDTLPIVIGDGFAGMLDEIAIFKGVLELEDVQDIMNKGLMEVISPEAVSPADKSATTWAKIKAQH